MKTEWRASLNIASAATVVMRGLALCIAACSGADSEEPSAASEQAIVRANHGSTRFVETARTAVAPCSGSGYAVTEGCYNEFNPPPPSIRRDFVGALPEDNSDLVAFPPPRPWRPEHPYEDVQTYASNQTTILPFGRATNDGRLLTGGGCAGCDPLHFSMFRPEALGHDARPTGGSPYSRGATVLHPFMWYNPSDTSIVARDRDDWPGALHHTICDLHSSATTLPQGRIRSPYTCEARYLATDGSQRGDCYDLSLLVSAERNAGRWELRSSDLTVFVPSPKTLTTGDAMEPGFALSKTMWVYPRSAKPTDSLGGPVSMPAFRAYDIESTPWYGDFGPISQGGNAEWIDAATGQVDWERVFTSTTRKGGPNPYRCFDPDTTGGGGVRPLRAGAPLWCRFFADQRRTSSFLIDDNDNDDPNDLRAWNGDHTHWLFETTTTGDGNLLFANMQGYYYAYNESGAPCHADGFRAFRPISSMPQDARLRGKYPMVDAQWRDTVPLPFRDNEGRPIGFGKKNSWAYGWVDREGRNFFFQASNRPRDAYFAKASDGRDGAGLAVHSEATPGDPFRPELNPSRGPATGPTVLGAWTNGKMVHLDNGLSSGDLTGLRGYQFLWSYDVRLYSGPDVHIRPNPSPSLFSMEQQLNHFDAFRPVSPFDVVWSMAGSGGHNAEIAFDEYMTPRAFIVAHMNAPLGPSDGYALDGFEGGDPTADVRGGAPAGWRFSATPRVQNASTASTAFDTDAAVGPSSLLLRGGARVEPLPSGGVLGHGVFLDGANDSLSASYAQQAQFENWYIGMWIDGRDDDSVHAYQTLYMFPDGSRVTIRQTDTASALRFQSADSLSWQTVNLGTLVHNGAYAHIGLKFTGTSPERAVAIYINGTYHSSVTFPVGRDTYGFNMMAGRRPRFFVGDPGPALRTAPRAAGPSVRAWIDELRVYALRDNEIERGSWFDEFICNTALGSMVETKLGGSSGGDPRLLALRSKAMLYPERPTRVCEQMVLGSFSERLDLPPQNGRTLCAAMAHKNNPDAARCLRSALLGTKERSLAATSPRPDFSSVAFCSSCHQASRGAGGFPALGPGALMGGGALPRWLDRRRQPMNVPAALSGLVDAPLRQNGFLSPDGVPGIDFWIDEHGALPAP